MNRRTSKTKAMQHWRRFYRDLGRVLAQPYTGGEALFPFYTRQRRIERLYMERKGGRSLFYRGYPVGVSRAYTVDEALTELFGRTP